MAGGAPVDPDRRVVIFSPARTASQQGMGNSGDDKWQVQFEPQAKWANPLIGWTSTADPSDNVYRVLSFDSQQAAVAFAERNGWQYEVEQPAPRSTARPKRFQGYGDNYAVKRKGIPVGGLRSEAKKA